MNHSLKSKRLNWWNGVSVIVLLLAGSDAPGQQVLPPPAKLPETYPTPPDPERVFRLESEAVLRERMAREATQGINPLKLRYEIVIPTYKPALRPAPVVRGWPATGATVEPAYLCYRRLFFEQINGERYGWSLGPLHPLISAGIFYFDVAALPYHAATQPLRRYECNTGYALPGDRMPLLLYPPELSLPGAAAEAAAVALALVAFP
jgi:hypothetical protein